MIPFLGRCCGTGSSNYFKLLADMSKHGALTIIPVTVEVVVTLVVIVSVSGSAVTVVVSAVTVEVSAVDVTVGARSAVSQAQGVSDLHTRDRN